METQTADNLFQIRRSTCDGESNIQAMSASGSTALRFQELKQTVIICATSFPKMNRRLRSHPLDGSSLLGMWAEVWPPKDGSET